MPLEVRWEKSAIAITPAPGSSSSMDIDRDELQHLKSLDPNLTVIKSLRHWDA
jgi:hypothetical protein